MVTATRLAPPSPAAVLRACHWLEGDAGLARVRNLSSSHSVHMATREDGAEAIVKRVQASSKRALSQELFVYRLASWVTDLREVLPHALYIDEAAQLLVLEALPTTWRQTSIRLDPDFHRRAGQAIALVHRATHGVAMLPSLAAGVLDLPDFFDAARQDRPKETIALMERIAGHELLANGLRQAKADYRSTCLIHGDLRPDHWVEIPGGTLKLIDWEMGGGGDPALDLASAVIDPALDLLRTGQYDADWMQITWPLIHAVVSGYTGNEGVSSLADSSARGHVARLASARLLHVACEWSDTAQLSQAVETTFGWAVVLMERQEEFAELLVP